MDPRALPERWPYRTAGRQLRAGPHRWWVLDLGPRDAPKDAPCLLLLHGLGASGHSFRNLIPLLQSGHRLIVPDLPGHGCSQTTASARIALAPLAEDLWALCAAMELRLAAIIGHSAGGAIALQMALTNPGLPIVGINAALGHFEGAAGVLFPVMAQALAAMPFAATGFSRLWGNGRTVDRLLEGTGSKIDATGKAQYLNLVRDPAHVRGALAMMANWRLDPLLAALPRIEAPVLLIAGETDRAVPPRISEEAAQRLPNAGLLRVPGGHLVHEEAPEAVARAILDWLRKCAGQDKGASAKII